MNLKNKMLEVIADVNKEVIEREELNNYIAIALLTSKNLFILGGTGQAKSYAIDQFRKRITGAKQFKRTLSKQTDEEALFGRLDLGSLIPGNVATEILENDATYHSLKDTLMKLKRDYALTGDDSLETAMELQSQKIERYHKTLSQLQGNEPRILIKGKIPDSHIVFIDEIFKANDGVLNSLLEALNEHTYTNEGKTIVTPVISVFAASNEIPQFSDPTEKILLPLYDRFEIKVLTDYVQDRGARLGMLKQKQVKTNSDSAVVIGLDELYQMQDEVSQVSIPDEVNTLMDDILVELRRQNIHVSDRKYFGYYPIVQAKAWLEGRTEVSGSDLIALSCYLWTLPEELAVIKQVLQRMCENPLGERINSIRLMGLEAYDSFEDSQSYDNTKALIKFRTEYVSLYHMYVDLINDAQSDNEKNQLNELLVWLENMSGKAHMATSFTYLPLEELSQFN